MTKNTQPEARESGPLAKIMFGVQDYLADATNGRRDVAWLSERSGIPKSTLYRKFDRPETFTVVDLIRIADAFQVEVWDLYAEDAA